MLKLNSKKGDFGASIIVAVVAVALVFGSVLYFFYVFKVNATLGIRDEYIWNKVQDVPLSLLSVDVDGESFVTSANKAYYDLLDKIQFQDSVKSIITEQLFYLVGEENRAFGYSFFVFGTKIDEQPPDFGGSSCKCDKPQGSSGIVVYYGCNNDCIGKEDKNCGFWVGTTDYTDHTICFNTIEIYESEYPVPLTFNGTDKFVDTMKYKVTEYH